MKNRCNSCSETNALTPVDTTNRPGLSALTYRIGTYGSFLETMKTRLSSGDFITPSGTFPLRALKTRDTSDPAIALLDAWAVIGDVLTFYQERIANEGYLRTATERRSIVELAKLVGYALRPGVSASTYLAYTLDPTTGDSTLAAGIKAQSVPAAGELPQTFETSADLFASAAFSNLQPRLAQPQVLSDSSSATYVSGVTNNLNVNNAMLTLIANEPTPYFVATVSVDSPSSRTTLTLRPMVQTPATPVATTNSAAPADASKAVDTGAAKQLDLRTAPPSNAIESLVGTLTMAPSSHPASALDLTRKLSDVFNTGLDSAPKLVRALNPTLGDTLYTALARTQVTPTATAHLYTFRVQAPLYGHNALPKPITNANGIIIGSEEWLLNGSQSVTISIAATPDSAVLLRSASTSGNVATNLLSILNTNTPALVTITQGSVSASASITLMADSQQVGTWNVAITLDPNKSPTSITFTSSDKALTYALSAVPATDQNSATLLQVKAGDLTLKVAPGQQATADEDSRHLIVSLASGFFLSDDAPAAPASGSLNIINLDSVYDKIIPGSWVVVVRADTGKAIPTTVASVAQVSLNSYGNPTRVSQLTLADNWLDPVNDRTLSVMRNTTLYAQSELLPLADSPITDDVSGDTIELGALYSDLDPGRWLIVSGERTDIPNTSGVMASELVMLGSVKQGVAQITAPSVTTPVIVQTPAAPVASAAEAAAAGVAPTAGAASTTGTAPTSGTTPTSAPKPVSPPTPTPPPPPKQNLPNDTVHSYLLLTNSLAYTYKRSTVAIYGNVVPATQGETRTEVLGSGDSTQPLQQFSLKASPLTYVPAATASGAASTLAVYVNGLQWHEVGSLADSGPSDRVFTTQADDNDKVTLTFGDGTHGMLLPTGAQNVQAVYRTGIGSGGNLATGRISQLSTRPLGVRAVVNPVPASGGADRDGIDDGRRNTPLASIALDRLVSVQDYGAFARNFAGVGKATSAKLSDGTRQYVVVSIAGAEGAAIDPNSQLVEQLLTAFNDLGEPGLPVQVLFINILMLVISARVKVLPDHQWTAVAPLIRAALLTRFSFDLQNVGEPVYLSAVINTIQQIPGVAYVVVDGFSTISNEDIATSAALSATFAKLASSPTVMSSIPVRAEHIDPKTRALQPAEIAYLNPDVTDTLLLAEITA